MGIVRATGRPISEWQQDPHVGMLSGRAITIAVLPPREHLYERINARFDVMLDNGALDEVVKLGARNLDPGLPVMKALAVAELAAAVGIDTARLSRVTFIIGVSTAGLAGVLLAPLVRVEPYIGLDYLMSSFFILIVGGLGTLEGLLIGSTVIGGTDAIVSTVFDKTAGYMSVLLISILFLWLRPDGIFYRR